jgi:hypothetical protein
VVLLTALERLWVPDSKTRSSSSPIHQPVRLTVPTRRDPTNPRCIKDCAADRCLAAESRRGRVRGMLATDRQRTRVVFIQYSILVVRQAGSGHNKRQRCCGRVSDRSHAHAPLLASATLASTYVPLAAEIQLVRRDRCTSRSIPLAHSTYTYACLSLASVLSRGALHARSDRQLTEGLTVNAFFYSRIHFINLN